MNTSPTDSDNAASAPEIAPGFAQAQVILKPRKSRPFYGHHPWVLESAIGIVTGEPADGAIVDLLNEKQKFIARGIFNSKSLIRVRLYTWDVTEGLTREWLERRLLAAIELRRMLGLLEPSDGARIVFSEADQLSGLIVDRYADYLSLQINSLAMAQRLGEIVPILVEQLRPRGIVLKQERGIGPLEGIKLDEGLIWGELPDGPIFITENQLKFGIDLRAGQKTGYYLDQRDNRAAVARYAFGKRVLDMCCYAGGFSLYAARNATEVLGVDSSTRAIALATENARLNNITNVRFEAGDVFETLDRLIAEGQRFGMIILDPPKFANKRDRVEEALMAYHRLNRAAVDLLEPGGILVTCSCSGHVQREDFLDMLAGVAQRSGRDIQILEQRGAAPDHPVSATCLETEYLKCFICRAG
jgi:23S rRNA (cytosine1962-C5)-methyltransferase